MPLNNRIGIVGAGIMGRLLAWQLHNAGYEITLFDKDPVETGHGAAYTAAGMLTPYCEVEAADLLIYQMGMKSLELWPDLVDGLNGNCGFQSAGSLVVAHRQDRVDLTYFNRQVIDKLSPTIEQFKQLNQQQLQLLEPELAKQFQQASYLPEEAWLCPQKTLQRLAENLIANKVNWYAGTEIVDVAPNCIKTKIETFTFDWVIDCRGLGARPQWPELRGVRGEVIWLQAPEVSIKRLVRLMHPRYRLYLVPKGYDDLYVVGATQIESDDLGPMTVQSSLELLSAVYSLHTGFAQARVIDMKVNCRPALADNLPKIEFDRGLIRVNGLFRPGFLLAPTLSNEVLAWLENPNYHSDFEDLFQPMAA